MRRAGTRLHHHGRDQASGLSWSHGETGYIESVVGQPNMPSASCQMVDNGNRARVPSQE